MLVAAQPDVILMVGGTDGGASASVLRMIETVGLAVSLLSTAQRPSLAFAGHRALGAAVSEYFQDRAPVTIVPNIRPSLDAEELEPAALKLSEISRQLRAGKVSGFEDLAGWSGGSMMLTADAFGRVVRYLSQVYD